VSATFDDGFDKALSDASRQLKVVEGGKGRRGGGGGGDSSPPEAPPEDLDWSRAPVECLGVCGETWWFVDAYRQIISIAAGKLSSRGALNALLGGDATGWAARYWPEFDKEGKKTGDYSPRKLHKALAERMTEVGLFDPATPRRGPGVWLHQGKPVVHAGARVFFQDGARKPSFIRDGIAYIAARAIALPNDGQDDRPAPGAAALAEEAEAVFRQWNWENGASDRMLLGWWTIANLGALAPMRPLAMIDGQEGAGKSTLLEILAALCPAGEMTNDTTEAGLRQRMNQRAAPMILDEFEGEELLRVLAMLRRIVTGEGSRSFRGQGSQTAVVTEVVGTAVMGAIGAPVANSAETTRILRLMLWPRAPGVPSLDKSALLSWCQKEAPALWGRAIAAWPRIHANAAMMRLVLNRAGCSPRYADMLGWLIGAREAMVADLPLTEAQAEAALEWAWGWVVTEAEQAEDTTAARCLQHLMACPILTGPGHSETVAVLVERALREPEAPATRLLAELGLRLAPCPIDGGDPARVGLYVAAGRRPALARLYQQTEWQGGRWGTVLAQLRMRADGEEVRAQPIKTRVRFSGENDRAQAVWLAPELLPSGSRKGVGMD
jgi:hypothetical protein